MVEQSHQVVPGPQGRLLVVDAASMYYRAYYGNKRRAAAPDGTPLNAVHGFLAQLGSVIAKTKPDYFVPAWDESWRPQWRVDLLPSYKAHRVGADGTAEDVPEKLAPQIPVLRELLATLGLPALGAADAEADDVIGTCATRWSARGAGPVDIVTGDQDLFQLVDDAAWVRLWYPQGGGKGWLVVDQAGLLERVGVRTGQEYRDVAILRGDPSDGLPGVPGIGAKTAVSLVQQYGSLYEIQRAAAAGGTALSKNRTQALLAAADYLSAATEVVSVRTNLDLSTQPLLPLAHALWQDPQTAQFCQTWGLTEAVARFQSHCTQ